MKKMKIEIGDVFTIPLDSNKVGFGQIVLFPRTKEVFLVVVFDKAEDKNSKYDLESICNSPILFIGNTLDAKLYHGDWLIIGNYRENIDSIELPYYKLGIPSGEMYLTNYQGKRIMKIDELFFNQLRYESTTAPIRFENALKAYKGILDWDEAIYGNLRYTHVLESRQLINRK